MVAQQQIYYCVSQLMCTQWTYVYRLQQLLFIYCSYVCVVVYAAFQANKVV